MEHRYSTSSYLPGMNNENQNPYQSHQTQHQDPRQQYDFAGMHSEPLSTQSSNHSHPYHNGPRGMEKSTLPPLQPSNTPSGQSNLPPIYTSQPPRSAHGHPAMGPTGGPDPHVSHQMYPPPGSAGNMLPPSSSFGPMSMSYSTAPAGPYPPGMQMRLPEFRGMPNGSNQSSGQNSPVTPFPPFNPISGQQQGHQPPYMPGPDEPLHVVGSQGRRGILPSEPGRLAVDTQSPTKSMIPVKDADGKYPCQHCNKTYLHAKHLKRHLLRRE